MEPTGHTGRTRLPTKSTARRLPNLAVACGLLLQALAGAAAADVCTEFRIALALEDASSEAYDTLAEKAKKKSWQRCLESKLVGHTRTPSRIGRHRGSKTSVGGCCRRRPADR